MTDTLEPAGLDYTGRQTYLAWTQAVAKAGGLAVRLPAQSGYEGVLGEKYPESVIVASGMDTPLLWARPPVSRPAGAPPVAGISYGYYLAPLRVRVLDKAHMIDDQLTITAGKAAAVAEQWSTGLLTAVVLGAVALVFFLRKRS